MAAPTKIEKIIFTMQDGRANSHLVDSIFNR